MALPSHKLTEDLSDLFREIAFELPEASEAEIEHFVKKACVKFCEESFFWHESLSEIVIDAELKVYDISYSRYADILKIVSVKCGDTPVEGWTQPGPGSIELNLNAGDIVDIDVAIKPKEVNGTFKMSAQVLSDYYAAILAGSKSYLYKIPRKPWAYLTAAQINDAEFQKEIAAARLRQADSFSRSPRRPPEKARHFF